MTDTVAFDALIWAAQLLIFHQSRVHAGSGYHSRYCTVAFKISLRAPAPLGRHAPKLKIDRHICHQPHSAISFATTFKYTLHLSKAQRRGSDDSCKEAVALRIKLSLSSSTAPLNESLA
jgi:hypothetical protein